MQLSTFTTNPEQLIDRIAEHGLCVINNFLPEDTVTALSNEAQQLKRASAMQEAGIGREHLAIDKNIRGDSIHWLDEGNSSEAQKGYFEQMESLRLNLNQHLYLGLFGLESHLAIYPAGAFYKRHLDCFAKPTPGKPLRKVTCIVYLNHNWKTEDGGQLRVYLNKADEDHRIDIAPIAGRAVIFLSDTFYHEVLPANRERISLTGWLLTRA